MMNSNSSKQKKIAKKFHILSMFSMTPFQGGKAFGLCLLLTGGFLLVYLLYLAKGYRSIQGFCLVAP